MEKDNFPHWDRLDPPGSLARLYQWSIDHALEQIDWYKRKSRPKRRFSQVLLVLAVLIGGLGALCPLIDSACKDCAIQVFDCSVTFLELGYILIAVAGLVVLFDKCFGFSSGWMRFMETQMRIEQLLDEFRFKWARTMAEEVADDKKGEHQERLLCALCDFTGAIHETVIKETAAWSQEFSKYLSEIGKMMDKGK